MKYQLITIKLGKLEDWQEEEKKKTIKLQTQ